jgi:hypothetical protein
MNKETLKVVSTVLNVIIFLVFFVLKVTGYLDWSWFFVTLPLWLSVGLVLAFWILFFSLVLIVKFIKSIFK